MSSSRVPDKVREVAKEDFEQAKALAQDAVRSGAYLYPFKVSCVAACFPSHVHVKIGDRVHGLSNRPGLTINTGHLVLLRSPRAVAPAHGEADPHNLPRPGRDGLYVCSYLRTSSCSTLHLQWAPCRLHDSPAGSQRELYHLQCSKQKLHD
jgi:hypothetical protein